MRTSIAGLSLVELMVALGIVGVLTMLAIPRYHAFMVKARRGEAKSNLSHIASLQSTYKIDYFAYYNADPLSVNGIGYKDGKGMEGQNDCDADKEVDKGTCNHLGFDPEGLSELRYLYQVRDSGRTVVASAASDGERKWVYPDCSGFHANEECGYKSGDAVILAVNNRQSTVCRNITKYCPLGTSGFTPVVAPPPVTTPPVTPTCDTATECCNASGVLELKLLPGGSNCSTSYDLDPVYCTCDPLTPPSTSCTSTQCCDSSTPRTQPGNLTCDDWYGMWSSGANDKGCCKCNPDNTFDYDNDHGNCCPRDNPAYTYHTRSSQGFCCPPGMYYSYDDSGSDRGKCCPAGRSYRYDPGSDTDGCCTAGEIWNGTVCVSGCGATHCCKNGVTLTDTYCKNIHGVGYKLQLPDSDPTNDPDCECVVCTEKDACNNHYLGSWGIVAGSGVCTPSHPTDPTYPISPNSKFVQHPTDACKLNLVEGCVGCCEADGITPKARCPAGQRFKDPSASPPDCDCESCATDQKACENFSRNGVAATWNVGTSKCTHPHFQPAASFVFVRYSHHCHGKFKRKCDSTYQCCDSSDPKGIKVYNGSHCNRQTHRWIPHGGTPAPDCRCHECTHKETCEKYGGSWAGANDNDPTGTCERPGYEWVRNGCRARWSKLREPCDSMTQCCKKDSDCTSGKRLEVPAARPQDCDCVDCTPADACTRIKGRWISGKCEKTGYPETRYKFVQSGCSGRFVELCHAGATCCTTHIDGTRIRTTAGCGRGQILVDPPINKNCICRQCTSQDACTSQGGTWGTHAGSATCLSRYDFQPPNQFTFIQSSKNPCTGDFYKRCIPGEQCCDGDFNVKTDDHCDPGERLADPPDDCNCVNCTLEHACRNSGHRWKNGRCTRSGYAENEYKFIQYPHDLCTGFWQKACEDGCDSKTKCCFDPDFEVTSAAEANLTCDRWHGDWNSGVDDKGCCICNNGKTFSYDISSESGACCPAGQSWNGTACE